MAKRGQGAYSCFYMHPRNRHQSRYDLQKLAASSPALLPFIIINKFGDESVDFTDKDAVKALNQAILKSTYGINFWEIPSQYLCPPIPGRADHVHSAADLFTEKKNLRVLDIGTGANCIYPLIGHQEYHWSFVGSDVDSKAKANAEIIVQKNNLARFIEFRLQPNKDKIFQNIIQPDDRFDLTMCNPPFHESLEEASQGTKRKWKNLGKKPSKDALNFGGQGAELWCPGGEKAFITQMIYESEQFKKQVKWFTTLVSKEANLSNLTKTLEKLKVSIKIIDMAQGQKISRLLCWTYH
jgi:23S rRNA (adenine1618-N6)-methyltransferase